MKKRAERFGIVKENEKLLARAARFGIPAKVTNNNDNKNQNGKRNKNGKKNQKNGKNETKEVDPETLAKIQKRAERFGAVSEIAKKEEQKKLEAEQAEKLKLREQRFKLNQNVAEVNAEAEK